METTPTIDTVPSRAVPSRAVPSRTVPCAPRHGVRRRLTLVAVLAAVLSVIVLSVIVVPLGVGASQGSTGDAVAVARDRARTATADRARAESELRRVSARRAELESSAASLDAADAATTEQLAEARRQVRELTVAAYIDGGRTELLQSSLAPEEAAAVSWRVGLVTGGVGQVSEAVGRYEQLVAVNGPARRSIAEQLDRARSDEADATSALVQAAASERDAGAAVVDAVAARDRAVAQRAARRLAASAGAPQLSAGSAAKQAGAGRAATVPSSAAGLGVRPSPGGASADEAAFLARVRACESHGNYAIVNPTGRYRGAYQFSFTTWQGVGGSGDPAAASPAEQDARALALLRLQGRRAWPVCGR